MELKEYFTRFAPNFYFHPAFKAKRWDGKISFFLQGGLLPIGLLNHVFKFCERFGYETELDFDSSDFGDDEITKEFVVEFSKELLKETKYDLRDYQLKAAIKALRNKRGIAEMATGSGKSISIYTITRYLQMSHKKILILVPSISLVEQIYSDFISYGWYDIADYCCKLYGNGKLDNSKQILISTWQSLFRKDSEFFEQYDALLIDEAHKSKANSIRDIAIKCSNASYRIGFTGTLPEHETERMLIDGYIGPVLCTVKSDELIQKGILSKININAVVCSYPDKFRIQREYQDEVNFIIQYKKRNRVLSHIFKRIKPGENTLILASRIEHLKDIERYLKKNMQNHTIDVIYGEVDAKDREEIRVSIDNQGDSIILGTYATMSTGINIKKIHHVIFFSSYKSKITILQSIGRGLRTHSSKEKMILWDVVDDLSIGDQIKDLNYGMLHFKHRYEYYKEQKFPMKIENLKLEE